MRNDYIVKITDSSRELTAREKLKFADTQACISLDTQIDENGGKFVFKPVDYVCLDIHNGHSENVDYTKFIVIASDGNMYATGSQSFKDSFIQIMEVMKDSGETDFEIECYKVKSKNYNGSFIKCSIV